MKWLVFAAMLLVAPAAQAADLHIEITGVRNNQGNVLVALCGREDFLKPHCDIQASVPAYRGTVSMNLTNIPAGTYAVQAFHDENGNGVLDRTLLGIPKEGMGFSRNAPMRFGPPAFDDAAVNVDGDTDITFALRY
jgi:uncharacterized protein (DUF2141 family)